MYLVFLAPAIQSDIQSGRKLEIGQPDELTTTKLFKNRFCHIQIAHESRIAAGRCICQVGTPSFETIFEG